ncbi:hypothetical protein [Streptomyces sp. NPDC004042]|uniref:hypothetical protein n=1 Tax=Streptomyces sp. NPDC004042 TaxID=3154451 RepID=UPI0033A09C03
MTDQTALPPLLAAASALELDRAALRDRIAEALREHYLSTNRDEADADRNMPCRCGDWREPGAEADDENDWDTHLADAVLTVLSTAADRYRTAWHSARHRAAVLSAEVTRRAPLLGEYAAQIADLRTMYAVSEARVSDLIDERDQLATDYAEERAERKVAQGKAARARIAEAALDAVEAALGDTLLPAARAEALAGIAAVLPEPADRAAGFEEMSPQQCPARKHADWAVDSEQIHSCPWCEVERLRADRAADLREAAEAVAALDRRTVGIAADTIRDAWEEGRDEGAALLRHLADEAQQGETGDQRPRRADNDPDRIVGYQSRGGRLLRCLAHHPGRAVIESGDFRPVTSEDLPNGGLCTYPLSLDERCGADVLVPQPAAGARQDGAQPS